MTVSASTIKPALFADHYTTDGASYSYTAEVQRLLASMLLVR